MEEEYNSKNIDKALQRMEQADELSTVTRSSTNIFQVFDEIEEEKQIYELDYASEIKRNKYLQKINKLQKLIKKHGNKDEITRIISIGALVETTNFNKLDNNHKKILKQNLIWCNKKFKKYLDSPK